jgi:DNA-binding transcriptional LysR family regulator
VDLRQLSYFVAIAKRQSFRQAADDVHVTQSALSQQIRRLETEVGVELFDRRRHPIRLTDAGEHLLPRAIRLLDEVESVRTQTRDFGHAYRGRVVLGAMQYLTSLEVPDMLAAFRTRHPMVELQLRMGNTRQLEQMLKDDEVDLVLCHSDALNLPGNFRIEELRTEELVVIVAAADPLAEANRLSIAELTDVPFITFQSGASIHDALQSAFAERGVTLRVSCESADMTTTFALVARGLGVALVPRSITENGMYTNRAVRAVPWGPDPITRTVSLVWRADRYHSRALSAFAAYAKRVISGSRGDGAELRA